MVMIMCGKCMLLVGISFVLVKKKVASIYLTLR